MRALVVRVIETLDDADAEPDAPARRDLRAYIRRQAERDHRMAEPAFMSFGPAPATRGDGR